MREFTFDQISGSLGCSAKSYQKTLKRKAGKIPWRRVVISVWGGELLASVSFDGKTYTDEMILSDGEITLPVAARAVRVRVPRRKAYDFISYNIYCRD